MGLQHQKILNIRFCFFWELLQQRGPHMGDAWEPFLFRSADPGRVLFFLEGIPPAWLLWYRLAGCIYIHTVTRKPAPTAEKEADLFATEVSLQNWNKLTQPVTVGPAGARHVFQSSYKLFLGAATSYYRLIICSINQLFGLQSLVWSIQQISKNDNECLWHVSRDHGDILKIFCLTNI